MEKDTQTVNYTIRLDRELKDRFVKTCKAMDSDSSKEIRKFMKKYLAENSQLTFN